MRSAGSVTSPPYLGGVYSDRRLFSGVCVSYRPTNAGCLLAGDMTLPDISSKQKPTTDAELWADKLKPSRRRFYQMTPYPRSYWQKGLGLLKALRDDASNSDRVFPITVRRIHAIVKATAKRVKINEAMSAHWLRHAHASHAIDNGAPITLVSQTLGHADLKTTSVYASPAE